MDQRKSGLVLELVAIRDIAQGEPLLLDYGASYQSAWDQHLRDWKFAGVETPSYGFFEEGGDPSFFRTLKEQETNPYASNLFTACLYRYESPNRNNNSPSSTLMWNAHGVGPQHTRPCRILERHHAATTNDKSNGYSYTVLVENRKHHVPIQEQVPAKHIVTNVPAAALRLSDLTYTTDTHLYNAFRHELHLPNDVFPNAWKDLNIPETTSIS